MIVSTNFRYRGSEAIKVQFTSFETSFSPKLSKVPIFFSTIKFVRPQLSDGVHIVRLECTIAFPLYVCLYLFMLRMHYTIESNLSRSNDVFLDYRYLRHNNYQF